MNDKQADQIGRALIDLLGLRVNRAGRVDLKTGDKTPAGLARTVARCIEEHQRGPLESLLRGHYGVTRDQIDNHESDLYILPADNVQATLIVKAIEARGLTWQWSTANVEGHDWHGRRFIEVPFGYGQWWEDRCKGGEA